MGKKPEILDLKNTKTEEFNTVSKAYLTMQKKESLTQKVGHLKLTSKREKKP